MTSTGDGWRLGYRPGLDGLRGVAVLLVIAAHLGIAGMGNAGAIGVSVFFTLSGFLITCLLLAENGETGRVALRRFYGRRARRLTPALVVTVVVVVALEVAVRGRVADWPTVLGALSYTSNFVRMADPEAATSLAHTWSLSVEEQFYLVWPLVFLGLTRLPRRWMTGALLVAISLSVALRCALWDGTLPTAARIYNGPDTRADGLLIGCLLAVVMHASRRQRRIPRSAAFLVAGLALTCCSQLSWAATMIWTPLVTALATCVVIYVSVTGASRPLTWGPLVQLGRLSYSLYLVHLPAFALGEALVGTSWAAKGLVWIPMAGALAFLSHRFVERTWSAKGPRPLRRRVHFHDGRAERSAGPDPRRAGGAGAPVRPLVGVHRTWS